jgi:leader peptidase (prepilin peptidase) / N-methyltransferase
LEAEADVEETSLLDDLHLLSQPAAGLPPVLALSVLAWCFVVGLCVGSFLNVVIARVPAGTSIVTPRSRCPKCGMQIGWRDNIPLLSWALLRAKCRGCAAPISARYPFVELLLGLCAVAIAARFGVSLHGVEVFAFAAILVAVAFVDVDTWLIPYPFVAALLLVGFGVGGIEHFILGLIPPMDPDLVDPDRVELLDRAIGAAGGFLLLGAVVVVSTGIFRRTGRIGPEDTAMGWGDPLLLAGIGAVLGWRALPIVVFLASLQGAVVGIALRMSGKLEGDAPVSADDDWVPPKAAVPFGPFLAIAALEVAFFGTELLDLVRRSVSVE